MDNAVKQACPARSQDRGELADGYRLGLAIAWAQQVQVEEGGQGDAGEAQTQMRAVEIRFLHIADASLSPWILYWHEVSVEHDIGDSGLSEEFRAQLRCTGESGRPDRRLQSGQPRPMVLELKTKKKSWHHWDLPTTFSSTQH